MFSESEICDIWQTRTHKLERQTVMNSSLSVYESLFFCYFIGLKSLES